MASIGLIAEPWHFLAAYSVLGGLGFGIVAYHNASTTVAGYFDKDLGLAAGVATSGSTAGQLVLVPLFAVAMTTYGWRTSYLVLAVAALVLVPLCLFVLGRPAATGGADAAKPAPEPAVPLREAAARLLASRDFLALLVSFTICGFTTAGVIITHFLPYAAACGFPPLPSATAYGVLAGVNLGAMIAAGWLSDRVHRPAFLAIIYGVRALAFVLLMYVAAGHLAAFRLRCAFRAGRSGHRSGDGEPGGQPPGPAHHGARHGPDRRRPRVGGGGRGLRRGRAVRPAQPL